MSTTATIQLTSSDLTSDALNLSTVATLRKAGTSTNLTDSIGTSRMTTTATSAVTLFAAASYTNDKAHKIYIKNTSSTATEYLLVTVGTQDVGRLYAGDWAFIPWDGTANVVVTPSVATSMTTEYALFYEA